MKMNEDWNCEKCIHFIPETTDDVACCNCCEDGSFFEEAVWMSHYTKRTSLYACNDIKTWWDPDGYTCSECRGWHKNKVSFCPHCGKPMKNSEENRNA